MTRLPRRFPYQLILIEDGGETVVVAVAHDARRPGDWAGRLGD